MAELVKRYLTEAGIGHRICSVEGPTTTAKDASAQLKVPLQSIIKSILFTDDNGSPVLAILTGDRRVDKKKLCSSLGVSKVRIAAPEVAKDLAGFEIGAMPPFGHERAIRTVIDMSVLGLSRVYGGSGDPNALIEIDPRDVARLTSAKVADICE